MGILLCNKKELTTDNATMWAGLKNVTLGNNTKIKKNTVWFHLYEILEQVNLTYTDRKQVDGSQEWGG